MWRAEIGGKDFICQKVDHVARAGYAGHLLLFSQDFDEGSLWGISHGQPLTLVDRDGRSLDLVVDALVEHSDGFGALRAVTPEQASAPPQGITKLGGITVHQRRRGESLTTLLGRVALPRAYEEIRQGMAKADIEAAIPPGGCIVTWSGESSNLRSARGVAAMARGSRVVVGAARGLADKAWRIITHNPGETERTMILDLARDHWRLAAGDNRQDGFTVYAEQAVETQWQTLQNLLESKAGSVEIADGLWIPLLPMTVRYGEEALFAAEIVASFDLTRPSSRVNTRFNIRVVPDPKQDVVAATPRDWQPIVVLARVSAPGVTAQLVAVEPAPADDGVPEELGGLPVWQSGDGKPLEAVQPVPGYARELQAALYTRWTQGDLVLVCLTEGNIPILLGAPRRRLDAYETDDGPDVVLHGKRLRQIADADDASKRTVVEIGGDGRVTVAAPEQLDLAGGIVVGPKLVSIARDIAVKGKVDVT